MRAVLSVKEEFYHRQIVQLDIMKPIFDLFKGVSKKDNLVTSAIIEIVDFIRAERIQSLISYIVFKHRKSFASCLGEEEGEGGSYPCLHSEVFERLILTHEQLEEGSNGQVSMTGGGSATQGSTSSGGADSSQGGKNRPLHEMESEDAYFNGDSDSDEDYGPRPYGQYGGEVEEKENEGGSGRAAGGYFSGLRPSLTEPSDAKDMVASVSTSQHDSRSSLSLISELYDDMEDDDDAPPVVVAASTSTASTFPLAPDGSDSTGIDSTEHVLDSSPPLPPLRSKFSCDDDDLEDNIFTRSTTNVKSKVRPGSSSTSGGESSQELKTGAMHAASNDAGTGGNSSGSDSDSSRSSSGGTVSFRMTKKKQVCIYLILIFWLCRI
jgi:hypothetical protein